MGLSKRSQNPSAKEEVTRLFLAILVTSKDERKKELPTKAKEKVTLVLCLYKHLNAHRDIVADYAYCMRNQTPLTKARSWP